MEGEGGAEAGGEGSQPKGLTEEILRWLEWLIHRTFSLPVCEKDHRDKRGRK